MNKILIVVCMMLSSFAATAQHKHTIKIPADIEKILQQNACLACHKADAKLVGPAYLDVAARKYTDAQIVDLIYNPKPSNWPGFPPMTPMKQMRKEDALKVASWINSLKKHQG